MIVALYEIPESIFCCLMFCYGVSLYDSHREESHMDVVCVKLWCCTCPLEASPWMSVFCSREFWHHSIYQLDAVNLRWCFPPDDWFLASAAAQLRALPSLPQALSTSAAGGINIHSQQRIAVDLKERPQISTAEAQVDDMGPTRVVLFAVKSQGKTFDAKLQLCVRTVSPLKGPVGDSHLSAACSGRRRNLVYNWRNMTLWSFDEWICSNLDQFPR